MMRKVYINYRLIALLLAILVVVLAVIFGAASSTKAQAAEKPAVKCFTSIVVEEGDTLASIAEQYMDAHYSDLDTYVEEVKNMNGLKKDSTVIHAGEHLTIPYYVEEDL